jgi:hypothetical protein
MHNHLTLLVQNRKYAGAESQKTFGHKLRLEIPHKMRTNPAFRRSGKACAG